MTSRSEQAAAQGARQGTLDFALMDPGIAAMPLFRPLPRRDRDAARQRPIQIDTEFDGRRIQVVSAWTLGADDLSVLLAVLALAGRDGKGLVASKSDGHRRFITEFLESEGDVVHDHHLSFMTTAYALIREAGLADAGEAYSRVSESLRRLSHVRYTDFGRVGGNSRFMRSTGSQCLIGVRAEEDEIRIALNARFAAAILPGGQFTRVSLQENRQLGEAARILHVHLCTMLRQGHRFGVGLDTLSERIYGAKPSSNRQAIDRRKVVRAALNEIAGLPGWSARVDGLVARISRPRGAPGASNISNGVPADHQEIREGMAA